MMAPRFPLWRLGTLTLLAPNRAAVLTAVLGTALVMAAMLLSVTLGEPGLSLSGLVQVLGGEASPYDHWLLWQSRLPRALCALGVGVALGVSGAVFQSLSRNPLGSPDIIGVNTGASAGTLLWLMFLPAWPMFWGGLLGAVAVLVLLLPGLERSGRLSRNLVLMGVAINAFALALVQFVLTLVQREQAQQMLGYLSGSLAHKDWQQVALIGMTLAMALPGLLLLSRRLTLLTLGGEMAQGVGAGVRQTRLVALLLATVLALGAVLCAGPVAFVALVAPHLARWGSHSPALLRSGLIGALLLLGADTVTLMLPGVHRLPVGVLTALLGGSYLAWILFAGLFRSRSQARAGL
ncbi:FecCD family ABC transporter permease [Marinobacterium marinum]|uniref:Iron chelate uptake ABC transporter family permease subunit n=1 Tax=Marinobacterium marinum TaxID=2756129 RepID=A0A7W2ACL4_9GAMM|nr:iron chelate uptake ABC transporter family permease subunit [Marinobacterium marinum]MBA4503250.1 iron chelate uptake ABC transporter family permease subunit [Marinobacterium marinum]